MVFERAVHVHVEGVFQQFSPKEQLPSASCIMAINPFGCPVPQQTPTLDTFISAVGGLIQSRDGEKLQDYLQIEPPWPPIYNQLVAELRAVYPSTHAKSEATILSKCEGLDQKAEGWIAFPGFMKSYLMYLRDVDVGNLLETYNLLKALLK
ncbi:hypothetical protein KEM54_000790 [Ascosphaera aggregata]|nr:hypothetical protein KEM54_000790 [Ascosphaera aggregata]